MPFEFLLILFVGLIIAVRFGADRLDRQRITEHIEERGGQVHEISWAPFGKGWFGEKNDRIYEVRYEDRAGNTHFAFCKTGLFSGVYFSEDRIVGRPLPKRDRSPRKRPPSPVSTVSKESARVAALEEENRRLREVLKRERVNR